MEMFNTSYFSWAYEGDITVYVLSTFTWKIGKVY